MEKTEMHDCGDEGKKHPCADCTFCQWCSDDRCRMRRLLYQLTQAYFHKVVTVRYLSSLYRELTGVKPRAGVKKVQVREGTEI